MSNAVLGAGNTQANMLAALAGSVVDPTNFLRTDAGNALLFVAIFRADLRYIEAWRTWAHWNGRRWELLSDTEGCSIAEAQLKEITSNEPITARKLHRDPFTFMPSHKTYLFTNHRPWIRRRLRLYLWREWRTRQNRFAELRRRGVAKFAAAVAAGSPTGLWRMSGHPAVQQALRNDNFDSLGLPRIYAPAQA
jgi:hypothetical protein